MKKLSFVVAAIFVIMAAALGWFLPMAAFNVDDSISDRKQMDLEIERVNLSYRDDLSIAQKINIVNNDYQIDDYITLDKGIYLQAEDVEQIVTDFLADFTGYRFNLKQSDMYISPILINLSNNRGTIVIWSVDCWLGQGWEFMCYIDDKTGAILNCSMYGDPGSWGEMISGFNYMDEVHNEIASKYLNALYTHYSKKLNAKFVTYHLVQEWDEIDQNGYRLIFKDDNDDTFEITLNISISQAYINTF